MKKTFSLLFVFITSLSFFTHAQENTIWLLNGKKVIAKNYKLLDDGYDSLNYTIRYKNIYDKEKTVYTDQVFSILKSDNSEVVFYKPQPDLGEPLQVEEMRQFVTGLYDVQQNKVNDLLIAGGFAAGLIGAVTPQVSLGSGMSGGGIPVGLLIPLSYISITGYFTPNDKYINSQSLPSDNEYYLAGFTEGYKKKSIKKTILTTCVGYLSGLVIVNAMNAY